MRKLPTAKHENRLDLGIFAFLKPLTIVLSFLKFISIFLDSIDEAILKAHQVRLTHLLDLNYIYCIYIFSINFEVTITFLAI